MLATTNKGKHIMVNFYHTVDGKAVSEEEFNAWADEMPVDELCWYAARFIQ